MVLPPFTDTLDKAIPMDNNDIIQKLWNLCDVLRDDGINYSDS